MTRLRKDIAFVHLGKSRIGFAQPELKICRIRTVSKIITVTAAPADEFNRDATGRSFRSNDFGGEKLKGWCSCVICHRQK